MNRTVLLSCSECTGGPQCEITYNYLSFPMSATMLTDALSGNTESERFSLLVLYGFLTVAFALISIVNNCLAIETCLTWRKIRITPCDMYLTMYSVYSAIGMSLLGVVNVTALFSKDQLVSRRMVHCQFLSGS